MSGFSETNLTGTVRLECDHEWTFNVSIPHKNVEIWCRKCQKMRKVVERYRGKTYKIRCRTCRYHRGFGISQLAAEIAVKSHRNRRGMHHHVQILDSSNRLIWEVGKDPQQPELPLYDGRPVENVAVDSDDPPF